MTSMIQPPLKSRYNFSESDHGMRQSLGIAENTVEKPTEKKVNNSLEPPSTQKTQPRIHSETAFINKSFSAAVCAAILK